MREDLSLVDFVIAKLDACSQESFARINRPMREIKFDLVLEGIKQFRADYKGKLGLQIMFIQENKDNVGELASLAEEIGPEEIQINTPLRPSPVKPLSKEEIFKIKESFQELAARGTKVVSVYEAEPKKVFSLSSEETLRRRGKVEYPHE